MSADCPQSLILISTIRKPSAISRELEEDPISPSFPLKKAGFLPDVTLSFFETLPCVVVVSLSLDSARVNRCMFPTILSSYRSSPCLESPIQSTALSSIRKEERYEANAALLLGKHGARWASFLLRFGILHSKPTCITLKEKTNKQERRPEQTDQETGGTDGPTYLYFE